MIHQSFSFQGMYKNFEVLEFLHCEKLISQKVI